MQIFENIFLKDYSWIKIGGQCKKFIVVESSDELVNTLRDYVLNGRAFDIIGWSANTLFADDGIDYDLVQVKSRNIQIGLDKSQYRDVKLQQVETRHQVFRTNTISSGYDTSDIAYDEKEGEEILVKADAGVPLSYIINFLNDRGIVGLHYFAGIPGTVGASVVNNIHGGPKNFSDYVHSVEILDTNGDIRLIYHEELDFNYGYSKLQHSKAVVISVNFLLRLGDKNRAKRAATMWAQKKASQPKNSLGSVFLNLTKAQQEKFGLPTNSVAYLIEHVLNLSGYRVGDIMVPEKTPPGESQINKNIIMNVGNGTAEDYYAVVDKIWTEAYKIGIRLKVEVHFKGFIQDRIKKFYTDENVDMT